jgi:very-short-patch-repair endonuclease
MPLELLDRWSPPGFLLESEAELEMSRILETGPGTQAQAVFARSDGWRHALKSVASDPNAIARGKLIVFPQAVVMHYRADFLVVCASVAPVMKRSTLSRFGFFVECDGLVGHAETAQQVWDDRQREQAIRRETGMDVLRFSGAEVMYQRREVQAVLGAQIEAMAALRDYGDAVRSEAQAVLEAVAGLASHRALRNDYTVRNSARSQAEPYDASDPFGNLEFGPEMLREATWDPFLSLRVDMARLAHSVARARQAAPEVQEHEPEGELQPFGEALAAAIEKAYESFRSRV